MGSSKWGSSGLVACSEEKGGERRTGRYDESVTFRLFTIRAIIITVRSMINTLYKYQKMIIEVS